MQPDIKTKLQSLYDTDYQFWLDETVTQLKKHQYNNLDLDNLIEEIQSLGKSDKRAILSYLMRLCEHLLKLSYWQSEREQCFRGWDLEISNFRLQIESILKDSPSLKNYLKENFLPTYTNARKLFLKVSNLGPEIIPQNPEFTLDQALDEDWLPWQPR